MSSRISRPPSPPGSVSTARATRGASRSHELRANATSLPTSSPVNAGPHPVQLPYRRQAPRQLVSSDDPYPGSLTAVAPTLRSTSKFLQRQSSRHTVPAQSNPPMPMCQPKGNSLTHRPTENCHTTHRRSSGQADIPLALSLAKDTAPSHSLTRATESTYSPHPQPPYVSLFALPGSTPPNQKK